MNVNDKYVQQIAFIMVVIDCDERVVSDDNETLRGPSFLSRATTALHCIAFQALRGTERSQALHCISTYEDEAAELVSTVRYNCCPNSRFFSHLRGRIYVHVPPCGRVSLQPCRQQATCQNVATNHKQYRSAWVLTEELPARDLDQHRHMDAI